MVMMEALVVTEERLGEGEGGRGEGGEGEDPPPPPAQALPLPAAPGPVPRPQAPPGGRWLDRDTNGCQNLQRIGESRQRPIELCRWDDTEAMPAIGKDYKLVNDRVPKGRQCKASSQSPSALPVHNSATMSSEEDASGNRSSPEQAFNGSNGESPGMLQRASHFLKEGVQKVRKASDIFSQQDMDSVRGCSNYLQREVAEARSTIKKLEQKCEKAQSYREKSSKLLEEAHRTLGRLEQAVSGNQGDELIVVASELKAIVARAVTLVRHAGKEGVVQAWLWAVEVYGSFSTITKMATLVLRKSIHQKFDKVIANLGSLANLHCVLRVALCVIIPMGAVVMARPAWSPTPSLPSIPTHACPSLLSRVLQVIASLQALLPSSRLSQPCNSLASSASGHSGLDPHSRTTSSPQPRGSSSPTTSLPCPQFSAPIQSTPPAVTPPSQGCKPLNRNSQGSSLTALAATRQEGVSSAGTGRGGAEVALHGQAGGAGVMTVGTQLKVKGDKVQALAYVPLHLTNDYIHLWWASGSSLQLWNEAGGSITEFTVDKEAHPVTALAVDHQGNIWTGHQKASTGSHLQREHHHCHRHLLERDARRQLPLGGAPCFPHDRFIAWQPAAFGTQGLLRVRQQGYWEYLAEDKAFTSPVRCIAFDGLAQAWVGDEAGRMKVCVLSRILCKCQARGAPHHDCCSPPCPTALLSTPAAPLTSTPCMQVLRYSPPQDSQPPPLSSSGLPPSSDASGYSSSSTAAIKGKLEVVASLSQTLLSKLTESTRSLLFGRLGASGSGTPRSPRDAGLAVASAGGGVGKSKSRAEAQTARLAMSEGPIRSIFVRDGRAWIGGGSVCGHPWLAMFDATTYTDIDVFDCKQFGPVHAMAALNWPQQVPRAAISERSLATTSRGPLTSQPSGTSWRLLTGHENGQLLLWHPGSSRLSPLLRIGEAMPPVRGIQVFADHSLVVTAHANGELHVFLQPSADVGMLPPGSESAQAASFGTFRPKKLTVKVGCLARAVHHGMLYTVKRLNPTTHPALCTLVGMQAHRSQLLSMQGWGGTCVTSSVNGSLRLWHAQDIANDVERHGLVPERSAAATAAAALGKRRGSNCSYAAGDNLDPSLAALFWPSPPSGASQIAHSPSSGLLPYQTAESSVTHSSNSATAIVPFPLQPHHYHHHHHPSLPSSCVLPAMHAAAAPTPYATSYLDFPVPAPPTSILAGRSQDRLAIPPPTPTSPTPLEANFAQGGLLAKPAATRPKGHVRGASAGGLDLHMASAAAVAAERQSSWDRVGSRVEPGNGPRPLAPSNNIRPSGPSLAPSEGRAESGGAPGSGSSTTQERSPSVLRGSASGTAQSAAGSGALAQGASSSGSSAIAFMGACQSIDASELAMRKLIGSGAYGRVWLAEWTGCAVAVKELTSFTGVDGDVRAWQEMQNEVHMLGTYNHPNIVRFMAICLDPPLIIMQFYPHGSLFDLLQRARSKNSRAIKELSWTNRLDMLRDVAAGMHYLHTRKPPVIHGDLRSPNLLLDLTIDKERPRFHVKIADFGLARMLGANSSLIMVSKTTNPRWTAPEVIRDSQIGPAGDVYSFAIVMWEMLTWQQPYEDMMSVQVIFSTVTDNYRPYMPSDAEVPGNPGITLPDYKALIELCWSADARKRPSFKQLVVDLQAMRDVESRAKAHAASRTRTPSAARLHPPPAAAAAAAPAHGMGGNSNDVLPFPTPPHPPAAAPPVGGAVGGPMFLRAASQATSSSSGELHNPAGSEQGCSLVVGPHTPHNSQRQQQQQQPGAPPSTLGTGGTSSSSQLPVNLPHRESTTPHTTTSYLNSWAATAAASWSELEQKGVKAAVGSAAEQPGHATTTPAAATGCTHPSGPPRHPTGATVRGGGGRGFSALGSGSSGYSQHSMRHGMEAISEERSLGKDSLLDSSYMGAAAAAAHEAPGQAMAGQGEAGLGGRTQLAVQASTASGLAVPRTGVAGRGDSSGKVGSPDLAPPPPAPAAPQLVNGSKVHGGGAVALTATVPAAVQRSFRSPFDNQPSPSPASPPPALNHTVAGAQLGRPAFRSPFDNALPPSSKTEVQGQAGVGSEGSQPPIEPPYPPQQPLPTAQPPLPSSQPASGAATTRPRPAFKSPFDNTLPFNDSPVLPEGGDQQPHIGSQSPPTRTAGSAVAAPAAGGAAAVPAARIPPWRCFVSPFDNAAVPCSDSRSDQAAQAPLAPLASTMVDLAGTPASEASRVGLPPVIPKPRATFRSPFDNASGSDSAASQPAAPQPPSKARTGFVSPFSNNLPFPDEDESAPVRPPGVMPVKEARSSAHNAAGPAVDAVTAGTATASASLAAGLGVEAGERVSSSSQRQRQQQQAGGPHGAELLWKDKGMLSTSFVMQGNLLDIDDGEDPLAAYRSGMLDTSLGMTTFDIGQPASPFATMLHAQRNPWMPRPTHQLPDPNRPTPPLPAPPLPQLLLPPPHLAPSPPHDSPALGICSPPSQAATPGHSQGGLGSSSHTTDTSAGASWSTPELLPSAATPTPSSGQGLWPRQAARPALPAWPGPQPDLPAWPGQQPDPPALPDGGTGQLEDGADAGAGQERGQGRGLVQGESWQQSQGEGQGEGEGEGQEEGNRARQPRSQRLPTLVLGGSASPIAQLQQQWQQGSPGEVEGLVVGLNPRGESGQAQGIEGGRWSGRPQSQQLRTSMDQGAGLDAHRPASSGCLTQLPRALPSQLQQQQLTPEPGVVTPDPRVGVAGHGLGESAGVQVGEGGCAQLNQGAMPAVTPLPDSSLPPAGRSWVGSNRAPSQGQLGQAGQGTPARSRSGTSAGGMCSPAGSGHLVGATQGSTASPIQASCLPELQPGLLGLAQLLSPRPPQHQLLPSPGDHVSQFKQPGETPGQAGWPPVKQPRQPWPPLNGQPGSSSSPPGCAAEGVVSGNSCTTQVQGSTPWPAPSHAMGQRVSLAGSAPPGQAGLQASTDSLPLAVLGAARGADALPAAGKQQPLSWQQLAWQQLASHAQQASHTAPPRPVPKPLQLPQPPQLSQPLSTQSVSTGHSSANTHVAPHPASQPAIEGGPAPGATRTSEGRRNYATTTTTTTIITITTQGAPGAPQPRGVSPFATAAVAWKDMNPLCQGPGLPPTAASTPLPNPSASPSAEEGVGGGSGQAAATSMPPTAPLEWLSESGLLAGPCMDTVTAPWQPLPPRRVETRAPDDITQPATAPDVATSPAAASRASDSRNAPLGGGSRSPTLDAGLMPQTPDHSLPSLKLCGPPARRQQQQQQQGEGSHTHTTQSPPSPATPSPCQAPVVGSPFPDKLASQCTPGIPHTPPSCPSHPQAGVDLDPTAAPAETAAVPALPALAASSAVGGAQPCAAILLTALSQASSNSQSGAKRESREADGEERGGDMQPLRGQTVVDMLLWG
ncbi:hypothetical protein QJQ45_021539 [Haematococcus lacustris]|nr:hypothetical protein QJQ45_021539 [Haematococcus lacustris]